MIAAVRFSNAVFDAVIALNHNVHLSLGPGAADDAILRADGSIENTGAATRSPRRRGRLDRYLDHTATVVAIVVAIV
jgi:hypothetical protein